MNTTSTHTRLVRDGALILVTDVACDDAVARWMPRHRTHGSREAENDARAVIHAHCIEYAVTPSHAIPEDVQSPTLMLAGVDCRIIDGMAHMRAQRSSAHATIDLERMHADVFVPEHAGDVENADVFSMLTLSSALLLARMHRSLVHSAAVMMPDNRVWLLTGDAYAGKTTTTLNLMRSGCAYLSDDQVILSRTQNAGDIDVEGWPRHFHVDDGWTGGTTTGARSARDPETEEQRWIANGMLGGLLFPRVHAGEPTTAKRIAPADALGRLIRQSPWVMTQLDVAPALLELLTLAATMPAFELSLGIDTYRDHRRLATILQSCSSQ